MKNLYSVTLPCGNLPILYKNNVSLLCSIDLEKLPVQLKIEEDFKQDFICVENTPLVCEWLGVNTAPKEVEAAVVLVQVEDKFQAWLATRKEIISNVKATDVFSSQKFSQDVDCIKWKDKIEINQIFASLIRLSDERYRDFDTGIVFLDSPDALTCQMLRAATSKTAQDLHIPHLRPLEEKSNFATWYPQTSFYEFMRDSSPLAREMHVGYDVCCTFEGNKQNTIPMVDLDLMFCRRILKKKGGILWVTFCKRQSNMSSDKAKFAISLLALSHGYHLDLKEERNYKNMYTLIWESSNLHPEHEVLADCNSPEKEEEEEEVPSLPKKRKYKYSPDDGWRVIKTDGKKRKHRLHRFDCAALRVANMKWESLSADTKHFRSLKPCYHCLRGRKHASSVLHQEDERVVKKSKK